LYGIHPGTGTTILYTGGPGARSTGTIITVTITTTLHGITDITVIGIITVIITGGTTTMSIIIIIRPMFNQGLMKGTIRGLIPNLKQGTKALHYTRNVRPATDRARV
jgi:hypothetical protein